MGQQREPEGETGGSPFSPGRPLFSSGAQEGKWRLQESEKVDKDFALCAHRRERAEIKGNHYCISLVRIAGSGRQGKI